MSEQQSTRLMKCASRREECRYGTSLTFTPVEGALPEYEPGQYVLIKTGAGEPFRPYVISQGPGEAFLRVTVVPSAEGKLPKLASLRVGEEVEMTGPEGDFTPDIQAEHPLVLLGGLAGIAPIVAILETLAVENPLRKTHVLYETASSETFALRSAMELALKGMPNAAGAVFFTAPLGTDRQGEAFDAEGEIEPGRLRFFCQDPDADFYIAGPEGLIARLRSALLSLGVIAARIHVLPLG